MYKRSLDDRALQHQSFFLFGPRMTGKSTWLKRLDCLYYLDLLDPNEFLLYSKDPGHLQLVLKPFVSKEGLIIIDEIQKVPLLLDVIHSSIERSPHLHFALSGSSARKIKRGAANLLAGRALYRTLHPLTYQELGDTFDLDLVLRYGSLPKIYSDVIAGDETGAQDRLRAYVTIYIQEEIKAEALTRNLSSFQKFLDVAVAQFGECINFSGISRDCQALQVAVKEYYSILEDTLIGTLLYPWHKSVRKRLSSRPKFYFFDNGVTRALLGAVADAPHVLERGRLFEQWIFQEMQRLNDYHKKDLKFSFWRTSHGAEVDFLIERRGEISLGIECKHRTKISPSDLRGIKSLLEEYPKIKCVVVAPIKQSYSLDEVEVLSPGDLFKKIVDFE